MRLKKIMSLVLACAMALSLVTVASAQDTEVYYVENFDSYADVDAFKAGMTDVTDWKESGNGYPANTAMVNAMTAAAGTTGIYNQTAHNANQAAVLENGKYTQYGASTITSASGATTFVPNKIWDYVANDEYTYVISYDRSWNNLRNTAVANNYGGPAGAYVWWADAAKSTAGYGAIFYSVQSYTDSVAGVQYGASGQRDPNSHRTSMGDIAVGTEYKFAVGITKGNASGEYYMPGFTYAKDGVVTTGLNGNINGGSIYEANKTMTNIGGFSLHDTYGSNSTIDNLRMYTIKKDDFKVYADNTTDVSLNTKTMRIYFSNIISSATYTAATKDAIVVKADGVAMEAGTYSVGDRVDVIGNVGGEIYSYVDVTFTKLEEGTTYTVEFPATIANEIGTQLGEKNVATFSTKMPDVKIMPLTVVGAESLVANGELQTVKAQLINSTTAPKNVALIYAVYAGDKLADMVYVNDVVDVDGAEYEVGLKLTSAGTVKAFAWDGMTSLKPYTGSVQLTVAAAQ